MASAGALGPICLLCWILTSQPASAFRALGLFPYNGYSHHVFTNAMMESLAERGHHVTVLSPFPPAAPTANFTHLDLSGVLPSLVDAFTYEMMTEASSAGNAIWLMNLIDSIAGDELCRKVFESRHFADVMDGAHGEFDVVFTEIFGSDCLTAVAYKLKVPLISLTPAPDSALMHDRLGSIDNPSYLINVFCDYLGKMSFLQRLDNVYTWFVTKYMHKSRMLDGSDAVVREFLGADTPPLSELILNTSLVLVNGHVGLQAARPVPPNAVQVGGLHARHAWTAAGRRRLLGRLEPGLRRWLDAAPRGVILFSLGSHVRASSLPGPARRHLLRAFAALPQRVLWKFEEPLADLPANVRIASWLPQSEVMVHPNVILFVTHGGLLGSLEALLAGVPMLGIPLFADQMTNMELYHRLGIAERLDHRQLNRTTITQALKRMTEDDRYLRRAREVSALYRDRPRSPEQEAVWWVEYVVRHRGAPHLRPLGADLPWYQYLLLDVAAAVLVAALVVLLLLRCCIAAVLRRAYLRPIVASSKKQE